MSLKQDERKMQPMTAKIEAKLLTLCHRQSIELMKKFMAEIRYLDPAHALDVAAGDGCVISDLLKERYYAVDCFDCDLPSVRKLKKLQKKFQEVENVDHATMQSYVWRQEYSGIFLRWCTGYIQDHELVVFLRKASQHLQRCQLRAGYTTESSSYIFVLDNLLEPGEEPFQVDGQRVRRREDLEKIFERASLKIVKHSAVVTLHQDFKPVMMWALC